jgi:hypothetical protein
MAQWKTEANLKMARLLNVSMENGSKFENGSITQWLNGKRKQI